VPHTSIGESIEYSDPAPTFSRPLRALNQGQSIYYPIKCTVTSHPTHEFEHIIGTIVVSPGDSPYPSNRRQLVIRRYQHHSLVLVIIIVVRRPSFGREGISEKRSIFDSVFSNKLNR
jgi:hypothetical protein